MTSSHKRIIRGANVQGVVFCTPDGSLDDEDPQDKQEREQLKSLEDFWQNKGRQEGEKTGFQQGFEEGKSEGQQQGYEQGKSEGTEEGLKEGYERGFQEGVEQTQAAIQESVQLMKTVSDQVQKTSESLLESSRPEIVRFSLFVAETILRRELSNPEAMKKQVEAVLLQAKPIVREHAGLDLHLHPEDLKMVEEQMQGEDSSYLHFFADSSMSRGDCRAETVLGMVNVNIQRLLQDLEQKVLEVRTEDEISAETGTTTPVAMTEVVVDQPDSSVSVVD